MNENYMQGLNKLSTKNSTSFIPLFNPCFYSHGLEEFFYSHEKAFFVHKYLIHDYTHPELRIVETKNHPHRTSNILGENFV